MRYKLLIIFSIVSLSASAQWPHIDLGFKKKHLVYPAIQRVKDHSLSHIVSDRPIASVDVQPYILEETLFSLEAREAVLMKTAKHNMSWRIYSEASYNFSDLAELYIRLNRLSEAKWYLLQSCKISREEDDDKHTITNLVSLALVKNEIGDTVSARADLVEAHDLANARGMKEKAEEIYKKILLLDQVKPPAAAKYAEATETAKKDL